MIYRIINYYTKNIYGKELEYIKDIKEAQIIKQLTGNKTITSRERMLIQELSNNYIKFERCFE